MSTVFITGASRGLGYEMARQYAAAGWQVVATCRHPECAPELQQLRQRYGALFDVAALDVTHAESIERLAKRLANSSIDLLINNAGDFGPRTPTTPGPHRQFFGSIDYDAWRALFEVNTLAPIRVAEALLEAVCRSAGKQMIFISSTIGSNIEGDYLGLAYGSSKAALNKAVTTLARVLRPRGIVAALLCPGHVRTAMGGPNAAIGAEESVQGMRQVIAGLTAADSGAFIRYNGERVAW